MEDQSVSVQSDRVIATPSPFARNTFYYVQECGYLRSIRSHVSKRENMDSYLIVYVLSGEGYFTCKGHKTKVSQGACFFVSCMEAYSHETAADASWELLWVHFNGARSASYYAYFSEQAPNIFYPEASEDIIHTLQQLLAVNKEKSLYAEAVSSELLTHLLTTLITTVKHHADKSRSRLAEKDDKLAQIRNYLGEHFQKAITLEELEEIFYISRFHLCREFRKKYGESIMDCLRNRRITQAKELLRFTRNSIGDIAAMCGIPDVNYFIKQFKKAEGLTPSEYRKKWVG